MRFCSVEGFQASSSILLAICLSFLAVAHAAPASLPSDSLVAVSVLHPLSEQFPPVARVGQHFSWSIQPDTFSSTDIEYLTPDLPTWLTFDPSNLTFSGTPLSSSQGRTRITLRAVPHGTRQGGGGSSTYVNLAVTSHISDVSINHPLAEQFQSGNKAITSAYPFDGSSPDYPGVHIPPNWSFSLGLDADTFTASTRIYTSAAMADGSPLPSWITYNQGTLTFDGVTPSHDANATDGNIWRFVVGASDISGYMDVRQGFTLVVASNTTTGINTTPLVAPTLAVLNLTVGQDVADGNMRDLTCLFENQVSLGGKSLPIGNFSVDVDTSALPWMTIDPTSLAVQGLTPAGLNGSVSLPMVVADGKGDTVNGTLRVDFYPSVWTTATPPSIVVTDGEPFSVDLGSFAASSGQLDNVTLSIVQQPNLANSTINVDTSNDTLTGTFSLGPSASTEQRKPQVRLSALSPGSNTISILDLSFAISSDSNSTAAARARRHRAALALGGALIGICALLLLLLAFCLCRSRRRHARDAAARKASWGGSFMDRTPEIASRAAWDSELPVPDFGDDDDEKEHYPNDVAYPSAPAPPVPSFASRILAKLQRNRRSSVPDFGGGVPTDTTPTPESGQVVTPGTAPGRDRPPIPVIMHAGGEGGMMTRFTSSNFTTSEEPFSSDDGHSTAKHHKGHEGEGRPDSAEYTTSDFHSTDFTHDAEQHDDGEDESDEEEEQSLRSRAHSPDASSSGSADISSASQSDSAFGVGSETTGTVRHSESIPRQRSDFRADLDRPTPLDFDLDMALDPADHADIVDALNTFSTETMSPPDPRSLASITPTSSASYTPPAVPATAATPVLSRVREAQRIPPRPLHLPRAATPPMSLPHMPSDPISIGAVHFCSDSEMSYTDNSADEAVVVRATRGSTNGSPVSVTGGTEAHFPLSSGISAVSSRFISATERAGASAADDPSGEARLVNFTASRRVRDSVGMTAAHPVLVEADAGPGVAVPLSRPVILGSTTTQSTVQPTFSRPAMPWGPLTVEPALTAENGELVEQQSNDRSAYQSTTPTSSPPPTSYSSPAGFGSKPSFPTIPLPSTPPLGPMAEAAMALAASLEDAAAQEELEAAASRERVPPLPPMPDLSTLPTGVSIASTAHHASQASVSSIRSSASSRRISKRQHQRMRSGASARSSNGTQSPPPSLPSLPSLSALPSPVPSLPQLSKSPNLPTAPSAASLSSAKGGQHSRQTSIANPYAPKVSSGLAQSFTSQDLAKGKKPQDARGSRPSTAPDSPVRTSSLRGRAVLGEKETNRVLSTTSSRTSVASKLSKSGMDGQRPRKGSVGTISSAGSAGTFGRAAGSRMRSNTVGSVSSTASGRRKSLWEEPEGTSSARGAVTRSGRAGSVSSVRSDASEPRPSIAVAAAGTGVRRTSRVYGIV